MDSFPKRKPFNLSGIEVESVPRRIAKSERFQLTFIIAVEAIFFSRYKKRVTGGSEMEKGTEIA